MADVVAVCEKCGAFVQAAHVDADGLAAMNPGPTVEHWKASPACAGSYGLMSVQQVATAREVAREALKRPRQPLPWYVRLRWWFVAGFHAWRLGRSAARRG